MEDGTVVEAEELSLLKLERGRSRAGKPSCLIRMASRERRKPSPDELGSHSARATDISSSSQRNSQQRGKQEPTSFPSRAELSSVLHRKVLRSPLERAPRRPSLPHDPAPNLLSHQLLPPLRKREKESQRTSVNKTTTPSPTPSPTASPFTPPPPSSPFVLVPSPTPPFMSVEVETGLTVPDLIALPGTFEGPREAVVVGGGLRERVEEEFLELVVGVVVVDIRGEFEGRERRGG